MILNSLRSWELQLARLNSIGKVPSDLRRLPGVARISPVNVPPRVHLEAQSYPLCAPGSRRSVLGKQRKARVVWFSSIRSRARKPATGQQKSANDAFKSAWSA